MVETDVFQEALREEGPYPATTNKFKIWTMDRVLNHSFMDQLQQISVGNQMNDTKKCQFCFFFNTTSTPVEEQDHECDSIFLLAVTAVAQGKCHE
jgi:hypothetical protein